MSRFVQDHREQTWRAYAGNVWRPLPSTDSRVRGGFVRDRYAFALDLYEAEKRDLAIAAAKDNEWDKNRAGTSDLWVGLEDGLADGEPAPAQHHLGTPDRVVELKTARIMDHDPALGIRGLTRGRYLPDLIDQHLQVLTRRFVNVFDDAVLQDLIALWGLGMTAWRRPTGPQC